MNSYTNFLNFTSGNYNEELLREWHAFQEGRDPDGIRPLILASWQRCRSYGVNTDQARNEILPDEEFSLILDEEKELLDVASPIMERLQSTLRSYAYMLNLANASGICLRTWRGTDMQDSPLRPGEKITEQTNGTSGIPLCFALRKPVVLYGAEHYCRFNHHLACVASPIIDQWGNLLGGISMSMQLEIFHPWSFTFMQEAALSISEQLRLRDALNTSETLIENFAEGILVLNAAGQIVRMNKRAVDMLDLANMSPPIDPAAILRGNCLEKLRRAKSFANEEVRSTAPDDRGRPYLARFNPGEQGGVLSIQPASQSYVYATKTAGINAIYHFNDILGQSDAIRKVIAIAEKYAASDAPVLILGESGTGKELFAQAMHNAGSRRNKPFVVVNCGALPRELVQSELFGYAEGAFTGARKQGNPGKFELADGGTIFLDEIGEMELDAQTSLLRFLQSGEVTRIGGRNARKLDVRVLAATNRDLRKSMSEGHFREDLFHRLNVFPLLVPPLRERAEDIPALALAVLARIAERHPALKKHVFSADAMNELSSRPWPGNVRELEHAVERIVFMAQQSVIQSADIGNVGSSNPLAKIIDMPMEPEPDEKEFIIGILKKCEGDVKKAAALCGTGKTTFYTKMNLYGLQAKNYRKLKLKNINGTPERD